MAQFPCDAHGARYTGPQRTAYPAIIDGVTSMRRRRRLCRDCFKQLEAWLADHLHEQEDDSAFTECGVCHGPDTSVALFVTMYDHGEDRADWYGRCCEPCAASSVALAFFGTQGRLEGT